MTRPDLDAIRARCDAAYEDMANLVAYVDGLHASAAYAAAQYGRLHDGFVAYRAEIDKAQAAFDYGCGQDGPGGWQPGETAIDALVRAKRERDELRATVTELRARIVTLEAMR